MDDRPDVASRMLFARPGLVDPYNTMSRFVRQERAVEAVNCDSNMYIMLGAVAAAGVLGVLLLRR